MALPPREDDPISRNALLRALAPEEFASLNARLLRVPLVPGQVLHEAGERIEQVFFIESGLVAVIIEGNSPEDGVGVELLGRDDVVGLCGVLNAATLSFSHAVVQIPGIARRVAVSSLHEVLPALPDCRRRLLRAAEVMVARTGQAAACNGRHALPERCARWLLAAHDQMDGDRIDLTHESLSGMLAVWRPGVSAAIGSLRASGLVQSGRGWIRVIDRAGLEAASCDCYRRLRGFTARLQSMP
ncbi:MAG TPA: Crp/Fnr family transcriptional regulator [Acetobacteraceae bacterium]|jgi:CRP-like cAMP-binding protein